MFSVDNFYSFFDSHYGWDKTQNMVWTFQTHGSKNLSDLMPFYDEKRYHENRVGYLCGDITIMHDQEPFFADALITYKNWYSDSKKHAMWDHVEPEKMLHVLAHGATWPIFCHSEINSLDINLVKDQGFVDCYYFWHGLVARDWFRHWKWHADLHSPRVPEKRFMIYSRDHTGTRRYRDNLIQQLSLFKNHVCYDWNNDCPKVDSTHSAKIVTGDVMRGAIQIVAETLFDYDKIHLTEKVFKPIVMKQPFFLVAGARSLEYLKNYGFKTFGDIWDESYDFEPDHQKRMFMIIKEIEKLCELDSKEFNRVIEKSLSIVDYNQHYFFSQEFEDRLLYELHSNMQNAQELQREKNISCPGGNIFYLTDYFLQKNIALSDHFSGWIYKLCEHLRSTQTERFEKIKNQYVWIKDF